MEIPFLDLKASYLEIKSELDVAVQRVLNSGWYIQGEEVRAFESEFAEYCNVKYCIGVGNGLDALYLILLAMDIGAGMKLLFHLIRLLPPGWQYLHLGQYQYLLNQMRQHSILTRPGLKRP